MSDINETITNLTMEYVKPKYPIYKIEVIENKINFDDEPEIYTHKKTLILEADDKFYDNWKGNNRCDQINESDKRCSLNFIKFMTDKKENDYSITYFCLHKSWYILSCERIA